MMRSCTAAALLLSLCACAAARQAGPATDPCASLPLLANWERKALAQRAADRRVRVAWAADVHALDCGAPDCYGTAIEVELALAARGGGCQIERATVRTREYVRCGAGEDDEGQPTASPFSVDGSPDLASRTLERLTLRSADARRALVIRPQAAYWFEEATAGDPLHESPRPEEEDPRSCCWAAVMSSPQLAQP